MSYFKAICNGMDALSEAGCDGIVEAYGPIIWYIYIEAGVPVDNFCAVYLGPDCVQLEDWTVAVAGGKPEVEEPFVPEDGLLPTQQVLHLTDVHLDLSYTEGNLATLCEDEMCCTSAAGEATGDQADDAAGYWGEYGCDFPERTYRDMLEHIKEQHPDISMIIFTGDLPAHDIYYQSREANLDAARAVFNNIVEIFGADMPFYAALGNHEAFPCNAYPTAAVPSEYEGSWLYEELADVFSPWFDAAAMQTYSTSGYFSVEAQPGFRIIGMHSSLCESLNFWLAYEHRDPLNHLSWLESELNKAEAAGERVWLLGHLQSGGGGCVSNWAREYTKIVNRYEGTISNVFYGHTHNDQYMLFYDPEDGYSRPTVVSFVAPSVTTYKNNNPAYRILTVDGDYGGSTRRVMDYDQYITDMSRAGDEADGGLDYFRLYSARSDLGLSRMLPADFEALTYRLRDDDDAWLAFYGYRESGTDFDEENALSEGERRGVICGAVTTDNQDDAKCVEIMGE